MTMQNTTKQSLAQRWEDYSAIQIDARLGMRCDRGRHDDHRVRLGRMGHRRHIPNDGDDSRRRGARRTGVGHLRRAIQGRTGFGRQARRVQGHHGQLQEAAVRRDGRLGDHAGAEVSGSACRGRLRGRTRSLRFAGEVRIAADFPASLKLLSQPIATASGANVISLGLQPLLLVSHQSRKVLSGDFAEEVGRQREGLLATAI